MPEEKKNNNNNNESTVPRTQDDDDPFIKGEFDVIKELLEKIPEAKEGKRKVE